MYMPFIVDAMKNRIKSFYSQIMRPQKGRRGSGGLQCICHSFIIFTKLVFYSALGTGRNYFILAYLLKHRLLVPFADEQLYFVFQIYCYIRECFVSKERV
jgi:hypothetical protein